MMTLIICMWAFLKEIFIGNKIKDPYKKGPRDSNKSRISKIATGLIDKMQRSRPVLAAIALMLAMSLFINYKTIPKVLATSRSEEEGMVNVPGPVREPPSKRPDIPNDKVLGEAKEETVKYFEKLYGVKK